MRPLRQFAALASAVLIVSILGFGTTSASAPGIAAEPGPVSTSSAGEVHLMPTIGGPQPSSPGQGPTAAFTTGNGIDYHGGPIVPSLKVEAVYWSNATIYNGGPTPGTTGAAAQDGSLLGYFMSNLGGSSYYNINTTYGDTVGGGHTVANTISYAGYWADNHNAPTGSQNVSDVTIVNEIVFGFTSGKLTYDPSTIYAVFSANNVNLGGGAFTSYCAYHGYFNWNSKIVLYAVMPYDYHSGCTALTGSPNNDFAVDAEVNVLTHELEETNTDPQLNAWYDNTGAENADKCAWTFGARYTTTNGASANIPVGTRDWLVQQQWLNANGGSCVKSYAGTGPVVPGVPTLNSATAGNGSVALGWSAPTSDGGSAITGYVVNRGTTSGGETELVPVGVQTAYTDTTAVNGTTYYYTVQAKNNVGTGIASTERSATPAGPPTVPGPPVLSSATPGDHTVALAWTAPASTGGTNITGYVVNRGTASGAGTQLVQLGVQTSYNDASAVNGTTYYYTVRATNSVGTGAPSNELPASPSAPPPPPGITFVKTIGAATVSKAGNAGLTISVPAAGVAAGNSVIVAVTAGTFGGLVACNDTKGNVYTVDADVTSIGRLFICSARNVTALTSADKISATYPGFSGMTAATASEFAGITGVDQKHVATGNSAAPNSGPVTTTHASELVFGTIAHNSTPTLTLSPSCGMVGVSRFVAGSGGSQKQLDPAYRVASAIGSFSNCGTLAPTGQQWQAEIVTYY